MSDINEQKIELKEEIKELKKDITTETNTEIKKGLLERLEIIEEKLADIELKWKGFQELTRKEEEEKDRRKKEHEEQKQKSRINKGFFDDE